ncbi:DUF494 family protein [Herminiimonas sp. CN]|uniref:DUF494 family protein n=1 Tax=Herminiimonas sp. CN TaxID=1349818 RepID=UPI000473E20D|nr:DUF494 domain-containing protein [Herminiimonas sp. CN]
MFDILVYLYETYYRPDACPDAAALSRKLSAVGFEDAEISEALGWMQDLARATDTFANYYPQQQTAFSFGLRIYPEQESDVLGAAAIGFIQFLEQALVLDAVQREIVIERALALGESPLPLDKLKVIVLLVLWSQGKEPDALIFDELFEDDAQPRQCLLH